MQSIHAAKARKLAILALLASFAGSGAALTVSIAPAEGPAYAPPPDGIGSPIGYLVTGCLDVLYDSGWVATNSQPSRVPLGSWDSSSYSLEEAKEGLVDYVIAVYVDWKPSTYHKDSLLPSSIKYRIFRVRDGKVLGEGEAAGAVDSEEASTGFAHTASLAGAGAARTCVKLLSTLVMGGE
jgi:hypothetical protein